MEFVQLLEVGCVCGVGSGGSSGIVAKKRRDATRPGGRERRNIIGSSGCGQPLNFSFRQFLKKFSSSWEQLLEGRIVMMTSASSSSS
jgi:hypothetical protein